MDRKTFFAALRRRESGVFGTSLTQSQVDGMNGILDAFITHGDGRVKTLAYALATAYHETGGRMVPVREGFRVTDASARVYVQRNYGNKGKDWYCWPAGPYGHVYYGRGIVQLTWLNNYRESSKDAGVDLVKYPDKALDPVIGARLLHSGLIDGRWNGSGKGIAHYLPTNGKDDLKNARRTVNVTDKWSTTGKYYRAFLKAINEAGGIPKIETPGNEPFAPPTKPTRPDISDQITLTPEDLKIEPVKPSGGLWAGLIKIIAGLFGRK